MTPFRPPVGNGGKASDGAKIKGVPCETPFSLIALLKHSGAKYARSGAGDTTMRE